jgi:predicted TIM-barrel fold metal-dependent hydrolase
MRSMRIVWLSMATAERLIDVDSHVIEPPDLWTSRVASKWGDLVPHVRRDESTGEDLWFIGDDAMMAAAQFAMVGWDDIFPQYPPTMDDIDPAMYDGAARLKLLDQAGVHAQLFYPNLVAGFFAQQFAQMDRDLALACVQAYNDFQTDFAAPDSDRLIALTALPFWDLDASVAEMERGVELGHRGVLFAHTFDVVGLPSVASEHWHPILDAAQSLGQSINFHVGFGVYANRSPKDIVTQTRSKSRMDYASGASLGFLSNARAINLLLLYGVCARYPDLKFVCVESGFGFVPYQLQALDWQWESNGLHRDHPDRLLPSEYFRRQVYATLWFEKPPAADLEAWQDNVMWETDYPHPTAQWPTPTSELALSAADAVDYSFAEVSDEVRQKVVHDNAAELYRIP